MKKKLVAMLAIASLLFATSCTKDDVDEPTLTVTPQETIIFTKAASEKVVSVTTNQSKWSAIASAEWIDINQSGNTLIIQAKENTIPAGRKAQIMVVAGAASQLLQVEQSASDATASILPDKTEVDQWGGKFTFEVNANTSNWTATSDAEWLKVNPKQTRGLLDINIAENKDRVARTAKITLSSGQKTMTEFVITQKGIMYYIMPYMEINVKPKTIRDFETARRSDIIWIASDRIILYPESPAFTKISYTLLQDIQLKEIVILAKSKEVLLAPEFDKFMTDNKFTLSQTLSKTERKYSFSNEKQLVEVIVVASDTKAELTFNFSPVNTQPYATFDKFPYSLINFQSTQNDVKIWETANGGIFNEKQSKPDIGFLLFDVTPAPWVNRSYIFEDSPTMLETSQFFSNLNLAFFESAGIYFFTKEFKALMEKEGFNQYMGQTENGLKVYANQKKGLWMGIRVARYTNVNAGKPVIELILSPAPGSGSAKGKNKKLSPFASSQLLPSGIRLTNSLQLQ